MSLSSIERKPPPVFRQGLSALTQLLLYSALAVFLMAADRRFQLTGPLRAVVATALLPVQQVMQLPVRLADDVADYLGGFQAALQASDDARRQLVAQATQLVRAQQLAAENERLRALLALRPALQVRSQAAEVLYVAPDPYSRKLFIDRGDHHGVLAGAPVVNEMGVLGQVTAVYPLSSEVTLLVDRDAAIPVLNARTQQRAAVFGGVVGGGLMEMRFIAANADVQAGDLLTTSGVDGVYPAALVVGKVARVERRSDAGFARILVAPAALLDNLRHVLVLEPVGLQLPALPKAGQAASAPLATPRAASAAPARATGAAAAASVAPAPVRAPPRPTALPASGAQP